MSWSDVGSGVTAESPMVNICWFAELSFGIMRNSPEIRLPGIRPRVLYHTRITSFVSAIEPATTHAILPDCRRDAAWVRSGKKYLRASSRDLFFFCAYARADASLWLGSRSILSIELSVCISISVISGRAYLDLFSLLDRVRIISCWFPISTGSTIHAVFSAIAATSTRISSDSGKRIRTHLGNSWMKVQYEGNILIYILINLFL